MIGLGLIQLQCPGDPVEDFGRHAAEIAPFHPRVVLHADVGEHRYFLTAQAPDAATPAADDPA